MEGDDEMRKSNDAIEAVWSTSEYWRGPGIPGDPKRAEEFLIQELMATRTNRRVPLSRGMQMVLFLIAMLLGGVGVLLLT